MYVNSELRIGNIIFTQPITGENYKINFTSNINKPDIMEITLPPYYSSNTGRSLKKEDFMIGAKVSYSRGWDDGLFNRFNGRLFEIVDDNPLKLLCYGDYHYLYDSTTNLINKSITFQYKSHLQILNHVINMFNQESKEYPIQVIDFNSGPILINQYHADLSSYGSCISELLSRIHSEIMLFSFGENYPSYLVLIPKHEKYLKIDVINGLLEKVRLLKFSSGLINKATSDSNKSVYFSNRKNPETGNLLITDEIIIKNSTYVKVIRPQDITVIINLQYTLSDKGRDIFIREVGDVPSQKRIWEDVNTSTYNAVWNRNISNNSVNKFDEEFKLSEVTEINNKINQFNLTGQYKNFVGRCIVGTGAEKYELTLIDKSMEEAQTIASTIQENYSRTRLTGQLSLFCEPIIMPTQFIDIIIKDHLYTNIYIEKVNETLDGGIIQTLYF